ncbi:MAG: hypothetical protein MUF77_09365 [Leptospira sp.]|nr:hypothetical protein [Leptospira sp.]
MEDKKTILKRYFSESDGWNYESFFGCDGGNHKAKLWVMAIEPGGEITEIEKAEYKTVGKEGFPYRDGGCKIPCKWEESKFDLELVDVLRYLFDSDKPDMDKEKRQEYLKYSLYNLNSPIFKLNLYPFPDANERGKSWMKEISNNWSSSIPKSKNEYYKYIKEKTNRFDFLKNQFYNSEHSKVLLLLGRSLEKHLREIFKDVTLGEGKSEKIDNLLEIRFVTLKNKKILIFSPFLSYYNFCINSASRREQLARICRRFIG